MKKKLLSALLCTSMAAGLLVGCGGAASEGGVDPDAVDEAAEETAEESAEPEVVTNTFGDPNGTHLEMYDEETYIHINRLHRPDDQLHRFRRCHRGYQH